MVEGPHGGRSLEWWELDSGNYPNITLIHVSEFLRFTQKHDLQENLPLSAMLFPLHSHVFSPHGFLAMVGFIDCWGISATVMFLTIYIIMYITMCVCFVPMICYASVIESTSVKLRISSPMEYHGSPFCLPQNRWLSFKFMQVHTSQIYTSQAMIDFDGFFWMSLTMTSLRRQVTVGTALTLGLGFFALQQLSGRDDGDGGIPRWFIRETPIKIDDLGEPPSLGNLKA